MGAGVFCPDCGSKLLASTSPGQCPRCLLQLGLGSDLSARPAGQTDTDRTVDVKSGVRRLAHRSSPEGTGNPQSSGVLSTLDPSIGPFPRILLRDAHADARLVRPGSPEMPDLSDHPGRYHLVGEVARGGMGAVLKGRDVDLGRDLAIKVILEEHRDHPEMVRRFVEEAQIGGQLQHPGIVPVHELGRFPDGRLYIAMKLVRGRTLAALLADRKGPADERPRFLSIFEHVCQTMAYAHPRGVVHRDLKPSNVMVGAFGEVQVMDWGLAKVLDQGGVADELKARKGRDDASAIRTVRTGSEAGESLAGSVLGTPAYMSPEQARGAIDTVDERADVFGLGSILCEILSGQPAYAGQKDAELYRMAERADLRDMSDRLDACGADAELIELTKSCLAPAPKDRPRDAGVVLAGLTAYVTGAERRLREAGLAMARAETIAAEERKRRIMAVALAVSVLTTGVLGVGGWAWMSKERLSRVEAVSDEVNGALDFAARKREQARSASDTDRTLWVQAIEAARRAESLLTRDEGSTELRDRVRSSLAAIERERDEAEAAEKDRRMVERLAGIHNDLGVHRDFERADAEYAAAFRGYGVDLDALDPAEAGARLAKSPVAAELANALDQLAFLRRTPFLRDAAGERRIVAVAKAADPDRWRNQLRDTLSQMNTDRSRQLDILERLAATADLDRLPEASVTRLAYSLSSLGRREKAIALLRRTQRAHPDDFWVNADLGKELLSAGEPDEAVRFFAVAGGIRPRSGLALEKLGDALQQSGRFAEATETLRQLVVLEPDDAHAHVALGSLLLKGGKSEQSEAEFGEAKRLKPDDWKVYDQIASARSDSGDWNLAIEESREAVRRGPTVPFTHNTLGFALLSIGRTDEAVIAFRQAIRLAPKFWPASVGLGRALLARGEFSESLRTVSFGDDGRPTSWRNPDPAAIARKAERMIALDARLPALLRGDDRPINAGETAEFGQLCSRKKLYASSVHLWSDAFAARPELASEAGEENRYQAACAAALAGCGLGEDDPAADDPARERLSAQALAWLNEELGALTDLLEKGTPRERAEIPKSLGRWQVDPALAGLREPANPDLSRWALSQTSRDFWSRVEIRRQRARDRLSSVTLAPAS
jgi:tetratricopeptide (TPR) repeat protein/tRNA A-37 threonylcarbamoyl transferase component Bud32